MNEESRKTEKACCIWFLLSCLTYSFRASKPRAAQFALPFFAPLAYRPAHAAILRLILVFVAGCVTARQDEHLRMYNDDGVYLFAQGNYRGASKPSSWP